MLMSLSGPVTQDTKTQGLPTYPWNVWYIVMYFCFLILILYFACTTAVLNRVNGSILRPRYFWICNFFFPDTPSVHMYPANRLFSIIILKSSLIVRQWGQRQMKVDDVCKYFSHSFLLFLSSLPHYQAEYLIFRKWPICLCSRTFWICSLQWIFLNRYESGTVWMQSPVPVPSSLL